MFDVQHRDERLPLKEWVLGVRLGAQAKAYPFSALAGWDDAKGQLADRLGRVPLTIRFDASHRTAEALATNGQILHSVMAFGFAWVAFHPKTEVLTPG
jgi:hypothetical protein